MRADTDIEAGTYDRDTALAGTAKWAVAIIACVAMQWAAVAGDGWVGLISYVDLGFHELGHMMLMWAPPVVHSFGGTLFEFGIPLGLALYFLLARKDGFAASLMLGWEAIALRGISVYIADAPVRVLPLLGGQDGHDWAFLLSEWGVIQHAEKIATGVQVVGFAAVGAGIALAVCGLVAPGVATRRKRLEAERLKSLPVREPRRVAASSVDVDE